MKGGYMFRNDNYVAGEMALLGESKRYGDGRQTDNDVRAHVEHEFSLMDQEHARIRSAALAARLENDSDGQGRKL